MERDRERVRREIQEKKEAMAEKLEEITDRVDEARDRLRGALRKLDVRYQVREHPWVALGLSVAAGYAVYRLTHIRLLDRVAARAFKRTRGAARKAREGGRSLAEVISGNSLARTAFDSIVRAAMSTAGGMLVGAVYQRLWSDDEDEARARKGEVLYEQKVKSPTAPSGLNYSGS